jgi:hypothetical protein
MRAHKKGQKLTGPENIVVTYFRLVSVVFFSKDAAIAVTPASPIMFSVRLVQVVRPRGEGQNELGLPMTVFTDNGSENVATNLRLAKVLFPSNAQAISFAPASSIPRERGYCSSECSVLKR